MPDAAPDRQLSGYELLGDRIGKGRFTLTQPLGCVLYYCEQQGLPPLTVLVVTKHGRPVAKLVPYPASDSARTLQGWKNGTTLLRVREARGAVDSARIVVRQRPKNIYFVQLLRAYRACPFRVTATVTDSFNFPVPDVKLTWRSSDTTL